MGKYLDLCIHSSEISELRERSPLTEGSDIPRARPNLPGVSPEFATRLSAEDLADIAAGDISLETVQAFEAAAVAREAQDLKEFFEERSAILERRAGASAWPPSQRPSSRPRAALADYPVLLAQVPDTPGPVDALPLGVAKVAVLKNKRVVRQGMFSGAQEVKPPCG